MLHVMEFKGTIQKALLETGCRFLSVSESQSGSGWRRYRIDYQRQSGRRERIFIYLFDRSSDASVYNDVAGAVAYQEELNQTVMSGMAESA